LKKLYVVLKKGQVLPVPSFFVSPKFQKRSALKFAGRTIPGAKRRGIIAQRWRVMRQAENERSEWPKGHYRFEALVVVRLSENEHSEV
jgi:hypothetical protein